MDNILAAIDFSDVSPAVIAQAAAIAKSFTSKLWLIHIAAPDPDFVGYGTGPQCERDWRAKTLNQEHRYLQDRALELDTSGIDVTPLLVQGATIETILQQAAKLKADMIILGSHGHGALYRALVGNVSEGVIRKASCPVLVIPAQAHRLKSNHVA